MGPATLNFGLAYAHPFLIKQTGNPGFHSMTWPLFEYDNLNIKKSWVTFMHKLSNSHVLANTFTSNPNAPCMWLITTETGFGGFIFVGSGVSLTLGSGHPRGRKGHSLTSA